MEIQKTELASRKESRSVPLVFRALPVLSISLVARLMMRYRSLRYTGLKVILLIPNCERDRDGVKRFRILMANQPKLMRRLLLEMLEEEPWIEFVGEATQEAEIRELAQRTAPDLVVVTADRPGDRPSAMNCWANSWHCALSGHTA
jgi:hypothetical protein